MRNTPNPAEGPLSGITVLDLTMWQNGPYATVILSDLGARVIKVEDPTLGDPGRAFIEKPGPGFVMANTGDGNGGGVSAYFEAMNRNKQSITIDLKKPQGRDVFYRLVKQVDVIVQNFRLGVVEKLRVDYASLKEINPRLVYASVTGLGREGPDAQKGVFDILGQARSGVMHTLKAPDSELAYDATFGLADQTGAIILAQAITTALVARERFGIGQEVEISQLGSMLMLQHMGITRYLINGVPPRRQLRHAASNPMFSVYRCANDEWIALGCLQSDRYWADLCRVLELPQLERDPRFCDLAARAQNAAQLVPLLDDAFQKRGRDYWLEQLDVSNILCAPVNSYEDVVKDPQVIANHYIEEIDHPTRGKVREVGMPIRFSATPGRARTSAPEFGQHTEEVLLEAGFEWEEIAQLKDERVV